MSELNGADYLYMPRTYEDIQRLAAHRGVTRKSLLALSPDNDPFYAGSPAGVIHAQWFADLWDACGYTHMRDIHLRRMHYKAVSAFPDLLTADTSPVRGGQTGHRYQNTEEDWNYLVSTSALARALGLVPVEAIVDHRNPPLEEDRWVLPLEDEGIGWSGDEDEDEDRWGFPALPDTLGAALDFTLPTPHVTGYDYDPRRQDYLVEVWTEKSTMNDILARIRRRYDVRAVPFIGFASITRCVEFLRRVKRDGRPGRVLFVSDFDPAGRSMPPAAARVLEFYRQQFAPDSDIKLTPLILTKAQVVEYALPRIPIKDEDRRKENFEDRHGEGAVELDALEAIQPGEFQRIVEAAVDHYIDLGLSGRLYEARAEANERLEEAWDEATADLQDEARALEEDARAVYARYERLLARLSTRLQRDLFPIQERMTQLQWAITQAKDAFVPPELERPTPDVAPDDDDWLYSSDRDYLDQLRYYHAHKEGLTVEDWEARQAASQEEKARERAQASTVPRLSEEELRAPFPEGCPPYDRRKRMLGPLCGAEHEHGTTGYSLRAIRENGRYGECMQCKAARTARGRRKSHVSNGVDEDDET
jgi:hypothetical protein